MDVGYTENNIFLYIQKVENPKEPGYRIHAQYLSILIPSLAAARIQVGIESQQNGGVRIGNICFLKKYDK